jgi:hypothetical protein
MGGKSRKSGGVSRRLIDRLIKEGGAKSASKKVGTKTNDSESTRGFGIPSNQKVSGQDEGIGG